MGRLRTPPPTDAQARAIIAGVSEVDSSAVGNLDFLVAFIRVVHDACGSLYGAKRYRELLRAYAPHRSPSTTTIQAAIDAVRATSPSSIDTTLAIQTTRSPARPRAAPVAGHGSSDMGSLRILEFEIAHYKARAEELERRYNDLVKERQAERNELARLIGERDAAVATSQQIERMVTDLAAAVSAAERSAAGSQRFALEQIEAARGETRAVRAQLEQATQELSKERDTVASYRRRINDGIRVHR